MMLKGTRCLSEKCPLERRRAIPRATRRLSNRGLQLLEKQKVRFSYGVLERQFRRFFREAERLPGTTGENLLILLERRLDNVVYRLGWATSRAQARQLVQHGHILVNGRKTDIPSCWVKPGDAIQWREGSTKTGYYKILVEQLEDVILPEWLSLEKDKLIGKMVAPPTRADIDAKFNQTAIVEYYSR